jgi:hypothetical protein
MFKIKCKIKGETMSSKTIIFITLLALLVLACNTSPSISEPPPHVNTHELFVCLNPHVFYRMHDFYGFYYYFDGVYEWINSFHYGEIDFWYSDDGIVQTGNEDFDRIAREFGFVYMTRAFPFFPTYPFPFREFLCTFGTRKIHSHVIRLKDDRIIEKALYAINERNPTEPSTSIYRLTGHAFIQFLNCQRNKLWFYRVCFVGRNFPTEDFRIKITTTVEGIVQTGHKEFDQIAKDFKFNAMLPIHFCIDGLCQVPCRMFCRGCHNLLRYGHRIKLCNYKDIINAFNAIFYSQLHNQQNETYIRLDCSLIRLILPKEGEENER